LRRQGSFAVACSGVDICKLFMTAEDSRHKFRACDLTIDVVGMVILVLATLGICHTLIPSLVPIIAKFNKLWVKK